MVNAAREAFLLQFVEKFSSTVTKTDKGSWKGKFGTCLFRTGTFGRYENTCKEHGVETPGVLNFFTPTFALNRDLRIKKFLCIY